MTKDSPIIALGTKIQRALRNGTGFNMTIEEALALGEVGVIEIITRSAMKELEARCRARIARADSEPPSKSSVSSEGDTPRRPPAIVGEAALAYVAALDVVK